MKARLLFTIGILFFIVGCSAPSALISQTEYQAQPAKLIGYSLDERYIYIEVVSHGCTMMSSFELRLVSEHENSFEVVRTHPDECRMKPIKMSLNYPFRHLGLDLERPVQVKNSVDKQLLASR